MIILTYLNKLVFSLQNENIPDQAKLALALFIFCIILLLSYINIIIYFTIRVNFFNKTFQNCIKKSKTFRIVVNVYRKTRIGFVIFEIYLSLYIILFLLYYSHKIYTYNLLN